MKDHEGMLRQRAPRAAFIALVITCVLALAKFGVWIATSSLTVLSQALDSTIDVVALGLVFVGVRIAAKPADDTHHYGHAKADNLVAFGQTVVLGMIVAGVAYQAILRLTVDTSDVHAPWYAVALLAASAGIDAFRVWLLVTTARAEQSEALRAGAVNIASDIGTALVAVVSLLFVRGGVQRADAIGALLVAVPVAVAAVRLGKRSADVLMDRAPDPSDAIERAAAGAPGVAETRRVRVRGSEKQLFADITVAAGRTSSLERAHDISEDVERAVERAVPGTDVVVHVEPTSETDHVVERVHAAASRTDGVHEVHNVLVHEFDEGERSKLHVTLHAKVDAGTSVDEAHDLSERVEAEIESELGSEVRVDTHIEPLPDPETGRDVTDKREDVVETIRRFALEEPDVLDCHEVLVTAVGAELSVVAHVRGRADLPLTRIHDASERMEKAIRAEHPEVGPVVIHFEPE